MRVLCPPSPLLCLALSLPTLSLAPSSVVLCLISPPVLGLVHSTGFITIISIDRTSIQPGQSPPLDISKFKIPPRQSFLFLPGFLLCYYIPPTTTYRLTPFDQHQRPDLRASYRKTKRSSNIRQSIHRPRLTPTQSPSDHLVSPSHTSAHIATKSTTPIYPKGIYTDTWGTQVHCW
ncbi:hypothetical protein F4821DRAFT_11877 [Hypoxylon rubiginosum]|uniref:Uncharacterized protein n=1 Tax=Hypoxylon rubiginosum TaxID=110542 RepID=A0ACC0DEJ4_9PEZI|nr:hypothetical protein F4821DRAFT_11877 [Hypoxylon rubiginosum]